MNTVREYSKPKNYIVSINEDLYTETLEKIIKSFNDLRDTDYLHIYLNSNGGDVSVSEAIIHMINQNCDRTVLIAHGDICSGAFDIFFRSVCERKILPGTSGMAHFARVGMTITKNNVALMETDKNNKKWSILDFKRRTQFYSSIGFSNSDLKKLQSNKDVYFDEFRLQEFLINHIKLINAGFK